MGCIAMNQFTRSDTLLLGLVYPEKPLCTSKTLRPGSPFLGAFGRGTW